MFRCCFYPRPNRQQVEIHNILNLLRRHLPAPGVEMGSEELKAGQVYYTIADLVGKSFEVATRHPLVEKALFIDDANGNIVRIRDEQAMTELAEAYNPATAKVADIVKNINHYALYLALTYTLGSPDSKVVAADKLLTILNHDASFKNQPNIQSIKDSLSATKALAAMSIIM